jgi:hypothetical protein
MFSGDRPFSRLCSGRAKRQLDRRLVVGSNPAAPTTITHETGPSAGLVVRGDVHGGRCQRADPGLMGF